MKTKLNFLKLCPFRQYYTRQSDQSDGVQGTIIRVSPDDDPISPTEGAEFFASNQQLLARRNTREYVVCENRKIMLKHPGITKKQMKEFREAFRLFDKDGDGCITKEELGRVMRSLGQFARSEELQQMLQEIDVDGDGNVSFEEFVDIAWTAAGSIPEEEEEEKELRDAFRVFDKHNRGYITASDLRAVLQCLGEDLSEEEIEDMIKEVDVDGDGRIDFYEFVNALGEPGNEDSVDDDDEETIGA
ncbi:neo-calmodulin-like isoform X3 [Coccinella septempunctata]|uniref:neo-calmodulin-like isoform X3 n=1 Tax=Coccinella septempunctata TaxID=41139 RepID=UPI001D090FED|nr:neo-calmodulin-like isoform X3 [Coccinella septempunctata]